MPNGGAGVQCPADATLFHGLFQHLCHTVQQSLALRHISSLKIKDIGTFQVYLKQTLNTCLKHW